MNGICLVKAHTKDAELVHRLQREAFMPLYERYRDDNTSPALETVERVTWKIENSDFYIIKADGEPVGGVRVRDDSVDGSEIRNISPIFLIPSYQDKGIGTEVMRTVFEMYPNAEKWELSTIGQETRDCHFYEKLGFVRTGSQKVIKDGMDIIGYEKVM